MYPSSDLDRLALGTNDYDRQHSEEDAILVSLEGLDASFRKVVPDFVVTSGSHVEEASWDE